MAEILARFKKEIGIILPYFSTFATQLTTATTSFASISGQYTELLANTSGLWKAADDI